MNHSKTIHSPRRLCVTKVHLKAVFICFIACVLTGSSSSTCLGQNARKFLLLKSGKIIEGRATKLGRESRIDLADGGYFVVATDKIEKSFRARRDVINYKIAITPINSRRQDQLLYWLYQQKAYEAAKDQLSYLEAHKEKLESLDFNRWQETLTKRTARSIATNAAAIASKPNRNSKTLNAFSGKIEQHLTLGCAISGCHSSDSNSSFKLANSLYSEKSPQFNNFQATKNWIQSNGKKEFLAFVSGQHGSLKRGMYPTATREYLAIATWVNSLESAPKAKPTLTTQSNKPKLKNIPLLSGKPSVEPTIEIARDLQVRQAGTYQKFVPRDEFDPEIFNRMQEEKWKVVKKTKPKLPKVSSAPQRLISPDDTKFKK